MALGMGNAGLDYGGKAPWQDSNIDTVLLWKIGLVFIVAQWLRVKLGHAGKLAIELFGYSIASGRRKGSASCGRLPLVENTV